VVVDVDVKALMTGSPLAVQIDAAAVEALDLMIEHGIRHLPVVDGGRQVLGVLSLEDLKAALPVEIGLTRPPGASERTQLRDVSVGDVMSFAPVTIRAGESMGVAAERMADHRIGCLPVVDADGRLEGILTETDVLRAVATESWTSERRRRALEQSERQALMDTFHRERAQLAGRLAGYEAEEQAITGARRAEPLDLPEHGSEVTHASLTEELSNLAARRLRAIEHAIERAEHDQLGVCERCGGRIAENRLRALPSASLCIRCARQIEAGS
jgi:acetoin utilization protein AcuB